MYATRAWCVFDLWYTIGLGKQNCDLEIILAPKDREGVHAAINSVVDRALDNIASESAEAFSPDDLAAIWTKMQSVAGGFDLLNETIRRHLSRWFQSQGGIRVARQTSRTASRAPSGAISRAGGGRVRGGGRGSEAWAGGQHSSEFPVITLSVVHGQLLEGAHGG